MRICHPNYGRKYRKAPVGFDYVNKTRKTLADEEHTCHLAVLQSQEEGEQQNAGNS